MTLPSPTPDHVHHWIVESPHDGKRMLDAECACGAKRQFPTSHDDDTKHWKPHIPGLKRSEPYYWQEHDSS